MDGRQSNSEEFIALHMAAMHVSVAGSAVGLFRVDVYSLLSSPHKGCWLSNSYISF